MTRLSLHHDHENPNLSIHLREGQYCTVGSSAAADYSFRTDGIDPVHCRIGCQASGGYIECFNVFSSITVNDVSKERSRLVDGDTLRIGNVELTVELPTLKNKIANFAVEFELEETPTTKVVEAYEVERQNELDDDAEPEPEAQPAEVAAPPIDDNSDSESVPVFPAVSSVNDDPEPAEDAVDESLDAQPESLDAQPDQAVETETTEDRPDNPLPVRQQAPIVRSHSHDSKPQFEFDSAEPADLDISHSEFEELSNSDSNPVPMGAVDLENSLVDAKPSESIDSAQISLNQPAGSEPEETESEETGPVFPGGTFLAKYWRWNGTQAIAAIQQLVDSQNGNFVYRANVNQISPESFEEISLAHLSQQQPAVFLISSLKLQDLQKLVRQKRWEDRVGHPQAVTMFLTFLPKRMLREFFDAIDACVLVHENDVELLRIRKTY